MRRAAKQCVPSARSNHTSRNTNKLLKPPWTKRFIEIISKSEGLKVHNNMSMAVLSELFKLKLMPKNAGSSYDTISQLPDHVLTKLL